MLLALLFGFAQEPLCFPAAAGPTSLTSPLIVTQVPRTAKLRSSTDLLPRVDGFDSARIVLVTPPGELRNLTADFAAACDPDISFDGKRMLFAAKKDAGSLWRIYELTFADGSVRVVTPPNLEARSPIYVSTLFTLDSPEPWFTAVFVGRDADTPAGSSLFNVRLDLPEIRQITFSPHRNFDPVQMWDGRVIYSSERRPLALGSSAPRTQLFAVHTEGSDVELFGGEKGGPVQTMACPTTAGLIVFVEPSSDSLDGSGPLCAVEERRPHVTYRKLSTGRDRFLHPAALDSDSLLVARSRDGKNNDYGIGRFDLRTGSYQPVFDTPEFHEMQCKLVAPRPSPDGHSSIVNPNLGSGTIYGLNSYDADPRMAPHLAPGTIHRVRFIEGLRASGSADRATGGFSVARLIGEAPVEADGSFNVEVPADTPLLLQTLDTNGMALATCGWFWVKTRESRGCIGCHEDPERIPENDYVLALRRPSNQLTLPAKDRRFVSFKKDVAPILAKHCAAADCHGDSGAKLQLPTTAGPYDDASLRQAYAFLLAPAKGRKPAKDSLTPGRYIDPGQARTSWLSWQLLGTNTARPWDTHEKPQAPRPHSPPLTNLKLPPEDLRTIFQWIDLGAQYGAP